MFQNTRNTFLKIQGLTLSLKRRMSISQLQSVKEPQDQHFSSYDFVSCPDQPSSQPQDQPTSSWPKEEPMSSQPSDQPVSMLQKASQRRNDFQGQPASSQPWDQVVSSKPQDQPVSSKPQGQIVSSLQMTTYGYQKMAKLNGLPAQEINPSPPQGCLCDSDDIRTYKLGSHQLTDLDAYFGVLIRIYLLVFSGQRVFYRIPVR